MGEKFSKEEVREHATFMFQAGLIDGLEFVELIGIEVSDEIKGLLKEARQHFTPMIPLEMQAQMRLEIERAILQMEDDSDTARHTSEEDLLPNQEVLLDVLGRILPHFPAEGHRHGKQLGFEGDVLGWILKCEQAVGIDEDPSPGSQRPKHKVVPAASS